MSCRMAKYGEPVRLRVPADFDQLPVVRALTRTLAVVADITLAADEVCTQLIASARPGSDLHCTITPAEHRLRITIAAHMEHPGVPEAAGHRVARPRHPDRLAVGIGEPRRHRPDRMGRGRHFVKHRAIEIGLTQDRGQPALTCPSASRSASPGTCTG